MRIKQLPALVFGTELGLVTIGYLLTTVVNVYQGLGASAYAVLVGLVRPKYIPYILILLSTIQDGPGLYKHPRYAAFGVLTALLFVHMIWNLATYSRLRQRALGTRFTTIILLGMTVVMYGFLISYLIDAYTLNKLIQPTRPYTLVAAFNLIMISAAAMSLMVLADDRYRLRNLFVVSCVSLCYLLVVALIQMLTDPTALHSIYLISSGAFNYGAQMSASNVNGFARIASALETPNAFCLSVAFIIMIMYHATQNEPKRLALPIFLVIISLLIGLITLSKSQLAYFFVIAVLVFVLPRQQRFHIVALTAITITALIIMYFGNMLVNYANVYLRIGTLVDSTRGTMWITVLERMTYIDWLFGRGYSHWEELFTDVYKYKSITAPHNYLMYVTGSFGVLGVMVYVLIFKFLFSSYLVLRLRNIRVALVALMLLVFIFIKDLTTTSYVFNTSPLTYLLWLNLGLVCIQVRLQAQGLADVTHQKQLKRTRMPSNLNRTKVPLENPNKSSV